MVKKYICVCFGVCGFLLKWDWRDGVLSIFNFTLYCLHLNRHDWPARDCAVPFFQLSEISPFYLFFYKYVSLETYLSLPSCSRFQASGHLLENMAIGSLFPQPQHTFNLHLINQQCLNGTSAGNSSRVFLLSSQHLTRKFPFGDDHFITASSLCIVSAYTCQTLL